MVEETLQGIKTAEGETLQVVSFRLGEEEFGVDMLMVQEINRMLEVTKVPQSPWFVEGVTNLRGKVVPVVSLRKQFGLNERAADKRTRIVIVEVQGRMIGMIVDAVSEVLHLAGQTVDPLPPVVYRASADLRYASVGVW